MCCAVADVKRLPIGWSYRRGHRLSGLTKLMYFCRVLKEGLPVIVVSGVSTKTTLFSDYTSLREQAVRYNIKTMTTNTAVRKMLLEK
jgi:hypothetical protein